MKIKLLLSFCCICFLIVTVVSCSSTKQKHIVFIKAKEGEIKITVDSVREPEMACFGIALTFTNNTDKKVLLTFDFDSIDNNYCSYQLNNFYLTTPKKDTFSLGIKDKYIILQEHSTKQVVVSGFLNFSGTTKKGYFNIIQMRTAFSTGKIEYYFDDKIIPKADEELLKTVADTFLIPSKLEVATKGVKFVAHICLLVR